MDNYTSEILQRLTAIETNMKNIVEERPQLRAELLDIEKHISESQQNVEHNDAKIAELNKRLNVFVSCLGTVALTAVSIAVTILFK